MGKYDDIINLPYPPKNKTKRIPSEERAAQFASFKALSGFDEAIEEENKLLADDIENEE